ncbi:hypothetical protein AAC387_Pa03g3590 [Persea americana]
MDCTDRRALKEGRKMPQRQIVFDHPDSVRSSINEDSYKRNFKGLEADKVVLGLQQCMMKMVINFTTTWCQLCKNAEPPMRKLAEEFPDVKFARVNIDLLQDVVKEFI